MKVLTSLVAIGIVLAAVSYAQRCPNPNDQRATIGGDTIDGYVSLQQRPLKSAQIRLLSNGKTAWVGSTNDLGGFRIKGLRPGNYRLTVNGWGSTTIRISPALTHPFGNGQMLNYSLRFVDNECVWTIMVMN